MSEQHQSVTLGEVYRAILRVEGEVKGMRDTVDEHSQKIAVLEERSPGGISAVVSAAVSGVITGLGWIVNR